MEQLIQKYRTKNVGDRVLGYVRVSTQMQIDGCSLDHQRTAIHRWATNNNHPHVMIYEDAGISGKDTKNRPQFNLMMSDLHKGDFVVVSSISRLSRCLKDFIDIHEKITNIGGTLIVLDCPMLNDGETGVLIIRMMAMFAEYERNLISARISNCMQNLSSKGQLVTKPRFGYMIDNNKMVPCAEEQEVISFMRECYNLDPLITPSQMIRYMQQAGYSKIRKAKRMYAHQIKNIMIANGMTYKDPTPHE